jgi:hypothetical protein
MPWRSTALLRDGAQGGWRLGTAAGPVASRHQQSHDDEDYQRLSLGERGVDWW